MRNGERPDGFEPISPELVLVDPEQAGRVPTSPVGVATPAAQHAMSRLPGRRWRSLLAPPASESRKNRGEMMSRVTRLRVAAVLFGLVALALVGTSGAGPGKLKCFAGDPATCSVSGDTVTLDTSSGGFAGAYYTNSRANGSSLTSVDYSFRYDCDPSDTTTACVGGGSPRWSIPIDTDENGKVNGYAFIDAAGCGSTGIVSTTSSTCAVNFNGVGYPNWDAFAAANPSYRIGNAIPFVITDTTEPGTTLIFAITVTE